MTQSDLFDARISTALRDRGIATTAFANSAFMVNAMDALQKLPSGEYTGEMIRAELLERGLSPSHPNCWGAFVRAAVRGNVLVETGRWERATSKKSHASRYPVYRK